MQSKKYFNDVEVNERFWQLTSKHSKQPSIVSSLVYAILFNFFFYFL